MSTSHVVRALLAIALCVPALPAHASTPDAEVCVLTVTQSRTPARKPALIVTALDCGKKPTEQQKIAVALVNNAMNAADALEITSRFGYEIEAGNVREGYTGHDVIGVYVLVKAGGEGLAPVATEDDELEDAPEATEPEATEPEATEPAE